MVADMSFLRPAAVECQVRKEVRRMGADEEIVKAACQAAARAIRAGETAHRAIQAGINRAADLMQFDRRRQRQIDVPPFDITPSFFDCVALVVGVACLIGAAFWICKALMEVL